VSDEQSPERKKEEVEGEERKQKEEETGETLSVLEPGVPETRSVATSAVDAKVPKAPREKK
jgi:hypothetical protein